ncbi:MAG: Phosphoribosylanthranilate isomerase [Acidobacteriaceae bacterium]|nr:Phosphoribosylanthranilate isomerase [Acidobacteriaceae bacterium]
MWIKICANTNLTDAALAAELGADALGFIFASSPRQVTPQQVAAIVPQLPAAVEKIGVFTILDPAEIADVARDAGLTGVQLHSEYSAAFIATLATLLPGLRLIQTTHRNVASHSPETAASAIATLRTAPHVDAVLVDSRTATASGGTGIAFDWNAARQALSALVPMPLIVAGGLTPENVRQAIEVLQPWGVDVASGVEASPGRKDPAKLADFIKNARNT